MQLRVAVTSSSSLKRFASDPPLTAVRFVRKMRGGSQACLIQCCDGHNYIVKFCGNIQGPNLLANEMAGTLLAASIGLPVPEAAPVYISPSFLSDNSSNIYFETKLGRHQPDAGIHFGSRLVGAIAGSDRATEYISPVRIRSVANRALFVGMYVVDVWSCHRDTREAVFQQVRDGSQVNAVFIDHGLMFGGAEWNFAKQNAIGCHRNLGLYSGVWDLPTRDFWITRLQKYMPRLLSTILPLIPSDWFAGDLQALTDVLHSRLNTLTDLVPLGPLAPIDQCHDQRPISLPMPRTVNTVAT